MFKLVSPQLFEASHFLSVAAYPRLQTCAFLTLALRNKDGKMPLFLQAAQKGLSYYLSKPRHTTGGSEVWQLRASAL